MKTPKTKRLTIRHLACIYVRNNRNEAESFDVYKARYIKSGGIIMEEE
jgi:hypothetical protein